MAVILSDIKYYAAAVTPEDDVVTGIGGAIDTSKKYDFSDVSTALQAVSSAAGDTMQTITVTYRDAGGAIQTLAIALNGTAVVANATVVERVLKAVKSGSCTGDVAVESQTAEDMGTLAGLGTAADEVVLDAGASSVNGAHVGQVFRATGGTGSGEIAEVIKYVGATKTATLSRDVTALFDATTVFRISKGVFFDKTPDEILYVVRYDYDSAANPAPGADLDFYQKGYFKHTDASGSGLTLTSCKVMKVAGDARVTFALDTAINGTGTNGANTRQVAPSSGVTAFTAADKAVPGGGSMAPGDIIGVWMELAADDGAVALNETWTPGFQGA